MEKEKKKEKKTESLPIINAHAAGIDIGSRSHFVCVGQSEGDVREFVYILKIYMPYVIGW